MNGPLVSIIVPVYNAAAGLAKCIETARRQTYGNIELLLVNDGSADSSPHICRMYARVDARIRVIDKENAGVSAARNDALRAARGDYIQFVDSDDYLAPNATEQLVRAAESLRCDLVIADYFRVAPSGITRHGFLKSSRRAGPDPVRPGPDGRARQLLLRRAVEQAVPRRHHPRPRRPLQHGPLVERGLFCSTWSISAMPSAFSPWMRRCITM